MGSPLMSRVSELSCKRSIALTKPCPRSPCTTIVLAALLPLLCLAACGGGGGGNSGAAPKAFGTAALIETDNAGNAFRPQIAIDPSGNAIAVWQQSDGTRNNIWSNRFITGIGWGRAVLIETDNAGAATNPQIAIGPNGNAIAVWTQTDGTPNNIWANHFIAGTGPGTGWGTAILIETDNASDALSPQIAIDANGNAIAVWIQNDGTRFNIWSNRFIAGTGWGTAVLIETDNAGGATSPQIAIDTNGNAIAVWHQFDGTRNNIWANRFSSFSGWRTAVVIETDAGAAFGAQIAFNPNGSAIAVWTQFDGVRDNIMANFFTPGISVASSGTWGTAVLIETDNAGSAVSPQIAIDTNGNAIVVWNQDDGTRDNIWANRFIVGNGWGTAALIETDDTGTAASARIAIDTNGNAIVVWNQYDGTRFNIWANRFQ